MSFDCKSSVVWHPLTVEEGFNDVARVIPTSYTHDVSFATRRSSTP